jgi:hypothetical protein
MSTIHFSYRREDSAHPDLVDRIYTRLSSHFPGRLVRDVPPGSDLRKYCEAKIAKSDILVVIIEDKPEPSKDKEAKPAPPKDKEKPASAKEETQPAPAGGEPPSGNDKSKAEPGSKPECNYVRVEVEVGLPCPNLGKQPPAPKEDKPAPAKKEEKADSGKKADTWASGLSKLNDLVRIQIEIALQRNILIVPVLIENAKLPAAADVPESLADFLTRKPAWIRNDHFESGIRGPIAVLTPEIPPKPSGLAEKWLGVSPLCRLIAYAFLALLAHYLLHARDSSNGSIFSIYINININVVVAIYLVGIVLLFYISIKKKSPLEILLGILATALSPDSVRDTVLRWLCCICLFIKKCLPYIWS